MSTQPLHPAYPFELDPVDGIRHVRQGTPKEIDGTGMSILLTPLGSRDSEPDLGLEPNAFTDLPLDEAIQEIRDATRPFDRRVAAQTDAELEDVTRTVRAHFHD